MIDLDGLEARAKAATPGKWQADPVQLVKDGNGPASGAILHIASDEGVLSRADANHIVGVDPETVLALCAEIRRLRQAAEASSAIANGLWILLDAERERHDGGSSEKRRAWEAMERLAPFTGEEDR